ncbi:MAG: glycoside hydrolase family 38 C-terminal domain-containing protein, partial [Acidobacteriota bacterium]
QLENLLLTAEKFSAMAMTMGLRAYYPDRDIDEAWKTVLRNQFHDIFDGSSIGPVYEESRQFYEAAKARGKRALDFSLETFTDRVDTQGEGIPVIVYNPLFWERTEPVEATVTLPAAVKAVRVADSAGVEVPSQVLGTRTEGDRQELRLIFIAEHVPSFGYKTYRVLEAAVWPEYRTQLSAGASALQNEFFRVTLNPQTGWIKSLFDKKNSREVLAGEGNILQAIVDEPESMSAWELGLKETIGNVGENGAAIDVLEQGPVRATVRIKSVFRNSFFVQDIILYHQVPRMDCLVKIDWQERNLMIKAAFPAAVKNTAAEFEIPFGSISRPVDGAEVPALKWIDLADASGTFGLSLLNDSKYGFDVKDNVMRISLVHG